LKTRTLILTTSFSKRTKGEKKKHTNKTGSPEETQSALWGEFKRASGKVGHVNRVVGGRE